MYHFLLASQMHSLTMMLWLFSLLDSCFLWIADRVSINLPKDGNTFQWLLYYTRMVCTSVAQALPGQSKVEHLHVLTVWQMESTLDLPCMCCADAPKSVLSSSNLLSMWVGCWLSAAVLARFVMTSAELCSLVCSGWLDICSLVRTMSLLLLGPVCRAASKTRQTSQCFFSLRFPDR